MPDPRESTPSRDALSDALAAEIDPAIMARLHEVSQRSGLSIREILSQAIDFAWHVEMSGELSGGYDATDTQRGPTPRV